MKIEQGEPVGTLHSLAGLGVGDAGLAGTALGADEFAEDYKSIGVRVLLTHDRCSHSVCLHLNADKNDKTTTCNHRSALLRCMTRTKDSSRAHFYR